MKIPTGTTGFGRHLGQYTSTLHYTSASVGGCRYSIQYIHVVLSINIIYIYTHVYSYIDDNSFSTIGKMECVQ